MPHSSHVQVGFIDEASQCTEPEASLLLLCHVQKLVLVGDPMQLGPTVISEEVARCGYDISLMKRLMAFPYTHSLLDTQYRMDPLIATWPNRRFYKNKLKYVMPPSRHHAIIHHPKERSECTAIPVHHKAFDVLQCKRDRGPPRAVIRQSRGDRLCCRCL